MELRLSMPQTADWLRQESQRGVLCQAALACGLCERVGWHNPRGKPCVDSARKALAATGGAVAAALTHPASGLERSRPAANGVQVNLAWSAPTGRPGPRLSEDRPEAVVLAYLDYYSDSLFGRPVAPGPGGQVVTVADRVHRQYRRAFLRPVQGEAAAVLGPRASHSRLGGPARAGRSGGEPVVTRLRADHVGHTGAGVTPFPWSLQHALRRLDRSFPAGHGSPFSARTLPRIPSPPTPGRGRLPVHRSASSSLAQYGSPRQCLF